VAHPQIATFARLANGGARPTRKIEGQKTLLSRTMHGISYDDVHDEFYLPVPFPQAVIVFRGGANGEEAPIRIIQGSRTQLTSPNRIAVDPVNDEIFIPEGNELLVFPRTGNGDVAPLRVLKGPDTQLGANAVAVDNVNNLVVVAGEYEREGVRFRIFDRTAQGNTKPKRVIGGPKSGFMDLSGPFTVYPQKGWIIAGDRGEGGLASKKAYLGVWSINDNGDVPPRWRVGGPDGIFEMPRGVALNPKHKEVMVSDKRLNAVLTFYFPEIF
jgi:hypothetical protein